MNTDDLIQNLSEGLEPREPLGRTPAALLLWFGLTAASLALQVWRHGLRPDWAPMLAQASYGLEIALSLALAIVAGAAALRLRVPGRKVSLLPLALIVSFWAAAFVIHGFTHSRDRGFDFHREAACFASIVAFSFAPLILLYLEIRKGASTAPRKTMALAAVATASASAAFLAVSCASDAPLHLLIGHALPLFVMALLLYPLGARLLAWSDR